VTWLLRACRALATVLVLVASGCETISRLLAAEEPRAIESYADEPHTLAGLRAHADQLSASTCTCARARSRARKCV
jgi:hypothetical protein